MNKTKSYIEMNFHYIPVFFLILLLAACNHTEKNKSKTTLNQNQKSVFEHAIPITINNDDFQKIVGWLDDHTIVFLTQEKGETLLIRYDLLSGKKERVYASTAPIKNVVISPNKKMLLIQSASLTYMATINVIDLKGNILFSLKVPSYDLNFNWNKMDFDKIVMTVFFEDWSYEVNILNIKKQTVQKYKFSDPFVKWFGKNTVLLQDWSNNEMHFFAPLLSYSLSNLNESKNLFNKVYQFDTFQPYLMTITIPESNKDEANYHFYNSSLLEMYSFHIPHLSQSDSWLVPYYDFGENHFITFAPYEGGSVDLYRGKFELISYNIQTKNKRVIMGKLDNEPIVLSPDGKTCLYGNQLNQLIDMEKGRVKSIVIHEKKSLD